MCKLVNYGERNQLGHLDIDNLFKIYYEINSIIKKHKLHYTFSIDSGNFETAIEFTEIGYHHPPKSKSWSEAKKEGNTLLCPDLLDYANKVIIEYEEEPKPGKKGGKLGKKGHTPESSRDTKRDFLYRIGGFRQLNIWESDKKWKDTLKKFLLGLKLHQ